MSWFRAAAVFALALAIGSCGFRPMYGGGGHGKTATQLAEIRLDAIDDRVGQEVRNRLLDRKVGVNDANAAYGLAVELHESISELSVQKTQFASRANFELRARYWLRTLKTSEVVFSGSSNVTSSFDVLESAFSTKISEQDARSRAAKVVADDIISRLGVYFVQDMKRNGAGGS